MIAHTSNIYNECNIIEMLMRIFLFRSLNNSSHENYLPVYRTEFYLVISYKSISTLM